MSDSIRDRLNNHSPIIGEQTSNPNFVALSVQDLHELVELAHEAVHPQESEVAASNLRMQALQLAHQMDISRLHALDNPPTTDTVMLAESYYLFLKGGEE